jgi:tetratricopeptide (TPR) repeat protein
VSRPWQADSVFKHGLIRLERRQIDRAVKAFEHATRLHPGVRTYRTEQVNALRTLAVQTPEGPDRERYFDQAWQAADEASRAHPANPDVWNNRGVAAMWMVQLARRPFEQEARRSFEKAIEFDPVFVDAWANLAKWEHLAGHLPQEIELWKKVLELDPNHVMGRRVLGQNGGEPRTAENLERPR